jgi:hypothetical protein
MYLNTEKLPLVAVVAKQRPHFFVFAKDLNLKK